MKSLVLVLVLGSAATACAQASGAPTARPRFTPEVIVATVTPKPTDPPHQLATQRADSARLVPSASSHAGAVTTLPPTPRLAASLAPIPFVRFVSVRTPVSRGGTGAVTVATLPGSSCSITVTYKSGPSAARGLGPKSADMSGSVSWSWTVGTRTTVGSWPIDVQCDGASARTVFTVQ